MTIDEAIKNLKELNIDQWRALPTDKQEAVNLGIEALKEVERLRSYKAFHVVKLLPGETKD